VTKAGAIAGILAGETLIAIFWYKGWTLAKLFPSWPSVITDLNIGIVALIVNVAVLLLVSGMTREAKTEVRAAA
jgi:SSS family solute:Na+ symporter